MESIVLLVFLSAGVYGQGRGGRGGAGAGAAPAVDQTPPTVFFGCVTGGNLQPVEQPFVLEASEPWVLIEVLTRATATGFSPTNYRVTGVNLTPWAGMRVKVEGALVQPRAGATGVDALPEVKATRVSSSWGTCNSPAAWTPPKK